MFFLFCMIMVFQLCILYCIYAAAETNRIWAQMIEKRLDYLVEHSFLYSPPKDKK